jgi:hypothetical protein
MFPGLPASYHDAVAGRLLCVLTHMETFLHAAWRRVRFHASRVFFSR